MKNTNRFYKPFSLAICLALLIYSVAYAASGGLDTTFSSDGKIIQGFGGTEHIGRDVAVQAADGKVVVVGEKITSAGRDFVIARYKTDGTLDTEFSGDGLQVVSLGVMDQAIGVVIQPADGKIVVSGQVCDVNWTCDFGLIRLNSNGTLDTMFGTNGKVITDFGTDDNGGQGLALLNGKIVVAGYMHTSASGYDAAVFQYTSAGKLDTTFSGDGILPVNFGQDEAFNNVVVYGGKIYVAGNSGPSDGSTSDFIAARINPNGTLDTTFGTGGKVRTSLGVLDYGNDLAISGGKVVVVGTSDDSVAIAQYTDTGALDTNFHSTGKLVTKFGFVKPGFGGVAIQGGKIIALGRTDRTSTTTGNALIARFTATGSLDTTFGSGGIVNADWGGGDSYRAAAITVARIYVIGLSQTSAVRRFIVAAYQP